jgi:hypothetical protein
LELAGHAAKTDERSTILPEDIKRVFDNDVELAGLIYPRPFGARDLEEDQQENTTIECNNSDTF